VLHFRACLPLDFIPDVSKQVKFRFLISSLLPYPSMLLVYIGFDPLKVWNWLNPMIG
jgi:hypothetical protein